MNLIRDLFPYAIGVVAEDNQHFFHRLDEELPIQLHRYPSGTSFNGWVVPQLWKVTKATISMNGKVIFDASVHPMGVATYSRSFNGTLDLEKLKTHLVTNPKLPEAYVWHSMWQYRPWAPDWAISMPFELYKTLGQGRYVVDIVTTYESGEMLVADYFHKGSSESTIVFNAHTCHPKQVNDDLAGVAVLVRLFQWLKGQKTKYSYRLVLAPEHLGTVFFMRDKTQDQISQMVAGAFAEMPGTDGPIKVASSFLGNQPIDQIIRHTARHHTRAHEFVSWRQGAGNDETVWEAPGYEVPFVEVSRCLDSTNPYPEYHTDLDTPDLMDEEQVNEFYRVFVRTIEILEKNSTLQRQFDGIVCLSNPEYNLYLERPDPAVSKDLAEDSEKWGYMQDCILRYFDGSMTVLDIADKHDLPFDRLYQYLSRFQQKGLVQMEFAPIQRHVVSGRIKSFCNDSNQEQSK